MRFTVTAAVDAAADRPVGDDDETGGAPVVAGSKVVVTSATSAADLQTQFEVLPSGIAGQPGWLGADSDVSIVIAGGATGRRALWIFADTYISDYDAPKEQREWSGVQMPHSTVALVECNCTNARQPQQQPQPPPQPHQQRECSAPPQFHWKSGADGRAATFWVLPDPLPLPPSPSPPPAKPKPLLWPVAGLASRDGTKVILLAQRIMGGMNLVGSDAIVVDDATIDDPTKWLYTITPIPSTSRGSNGALNNGTLTWFSAIEWAHPEDADDETVFLFGHDSSLKQIGRKSLLARANFSRLLQGDWSQLGYWTTAGWKSGAYDSAAMQPLAVPSWETTLRWSSELQRWYTFNADHGYGGGNISLWTALEVTGEWESTYAYTMPSPFTPEGGEWLCYAAKSHPELAAAHAEVPAAAEAAASSSSSASPPPPPAPLPEGQEVELIFSWICNTAGNASVTQAQEFQPGGMVLARRGYWFRFVRLMAKVVTDTATAAAAPSVKMDGVFITN